MCWYLKSSLVNLANSHALYLASGGSNVYTESGMRYFPVLVSFCCLTSYLLLYIFNFAYMGLLISASVIGFCALKISFLTRSFSASNFSILSCAGPLRPSGLPPYNPVLVDFQVFKEFPKCSGCSGCRLYLYVLYLRSTQIHSSIIMIYAGGNPRADLRTPEAIPVRIRARNQ
jgi:hypothetical protein